MVRIEQSARPPASEVQVWRGQRFRFYQGSGVNKGYDGAKLDKGVIVVTEHGI